MLQIRDVIRAYLPAIVFVVLGIGLGAIFATLNSVLGPKPKYRRAATAEPYESGLPSEVKKSMRFGISFYLVAMLFILFDIETIFLFPVAVQLKAFGTFALVEIVRVHRAAVRGLRLRVAQRGTGMEIVRQQLGNGNDGEFRARQLSARRMLTGELDGSDLDAYVEERVMTTTLDKAANWARGNAFMPATFGLACCAIEMMAAVNARMDIARFGFEAFRASPAPGRPDDHLGPRLDQDGAGRPPHLRPDARAQVGDRDGRLQLVDGRLQQLRDRAGRQVPAGRHPRPRLPAAARGAGLRDPEAARDGHGQARRGLAHALRRSRHGGVRRVRAARSRASPGA